MMLIQSWSQWWLLLEDFILFAAILLVLFVLACGLAYLSGGTDPEPPGRYGE